MVSVNGAIMDSLSSDFSAARVTVMTIYKYEIYMVSKIANTCPLKIPHTPLSQAPQNTLP